MKNIFLIALSFYIFFSCTNAIKNNVPVENEFGIESTSATTSELLSNEVTQNLSIKNKKDLIGFWVGYFKNAEDDGYKKAVENDGLYWNRENKINFSIDKIEGENIFGHSVVAGNNRTFKGKITENKSTFIIEVSEPGDHKYDGKFKAEILKNDSVLNGTWNSYKKIDISTRKYNLTKKIYKYNPNQKLSDSRRRYGNWEIFKTKKNKEDYGDGETDYLYKEFSVSTENSFKINASNTLLTKKMLENLVKGDLLIIRNTIYARHGYSFKNRPLRVYFDAQDWYIPVHSNIKSKFTEIEKQNIKLLLKYEKNAKEYYDTFGRG